MLTRLLKRVVFQRITGRMNKFTLLEQPHLIIPPNGIINRVRFVRIWFVPTTEQPTNA
jgi:hypothetical protein